MHQALQHFLERPRNKVGGALLFFVASRDLWWGRARVLQNMVEWRVSYKTYSLWRVSYKLWGSGCVLQIRVVGFILVGCRVVLLVLVVWVGQFVLVLFRDMYRDLVIRIY